MMKQLILLLILFMFSGCGIKRGFNIDHGNGKPIEDTQDNRFTQIEEGDFNAEYFFYIYQDNQTGKKYMLLDPIKAYGGHVAVAISPYQE